jgi:hypothetical protein
MINLFSHEVEHIRFETSKDLSFRILSWYVPILHIWVDREELLRHDLHLFPSLESFFNGCQDYVAFKSFQ